jgi:hypothetical protein
MLRNTLDDMQFTCNEKYAHMRVCIVTGHGLDHRGVAVRVPVGSRIFSTSSRPAFGPTQPRVQWVPGVKRSGREADYY